MAQDIIMIEITEVRNAVSLRQDNSVMDVEINHPTFGWIPYTINHADTDKTINNEELLELIGDDYQPYAEKAINVEDWRSFAQISRTEFLTSLNELGILADEEAELAAGGGWPTRFDEMLTQMSNVTERIAAKSKWATLSVVRRNSPLILGLANLSGVTESQLDQIFGWNA